MNHLLHRLIFNATRGQIIAVAETAHASGKAASGEGGVGRVSMPNWPAARTSIVDTTIKCIAFAAAIVCAGLAPAAWAQGVPATTVVANAAAPAGQRPTLTTSASGTPQVNIQSAVGGVSRNQYTQFDVGANGLVLNNSPISSNTQLAGWVAGNTNLAGGSASIILNEVSSANASLLRGYIEVAGQKAEVVIANPAGISVNGGGFINASGATLTTGTPQFSGNTLTGYQVGGGTISVSGTGLDSASTPITTLQARQIILQGAVHAQDLRVNADNSTGSANAVAIDVAAIGGMYANTITILATGQGAGVNNAGTLQANAGSFTLSADGKGMLSNSIDNASQSGSSSGQTKAAISAGTVRITDDAAQTQLTGNTGAQTVASLNRDTQNANTVAQRQDVQAMKQTVETERAIKNEAVKQLTTLTDEAYRVMFKEVPKFYKVTCPANTNCTTHPEKAVVQLVDKDTQTELANAPSGAVLAVNGIDNPLERAGQLAMQNAEPVNKTEQNPEGEKPRTIYLMHYVPANNGLSELMIAAYEKSLASTLGYSNQDEAYAAAIQARGQLETTSLGHSRGTIVQTNANNMLGEQNFTNPNLSVRGVGGAVTGETYAEAALKVAGDDAAKNITFNYFKNDPVPVVAGGNSGVISLSEFWKVLSTSNSAHSCYGTGAAGCAQVEILTPSAPKDANQNNSNLIRYVGGKPFDASGKPLELKN